MRTAAAGRAEGGGILSKFLTTAAMALALAGVGLSAAAQPPDDHHHDQGGGGQKPPPPAKGAPPKGGAPGGGAPGVV